MVSGGRAGQYKDAGTDDCADAQHDQLARGERASQMRLAL